MNRYAPDALFRSHGSKARFLPSPPYSHIVKSDMLCVGFSFSDLRGKLHPTDFIWPIDTGSSTPIQRKAALQIIREDKRCKVLLMTIQTGGCGESALYTTALRDQSVMSYPLGEQV